MPRPVVLLVPLLLAGPAAAVDLAFPVACTPGTDCYLQNLFDHDPGPGARDAACGPLAYDGHDGTDIALPTLADQRRGVDVLAAAPGVVLGTRDGMPDIPQGGPDSPDVTGVECGNGVVLAHEDGWQTQYCHMAQGSVAVREGETIAAGQRLGRIGLSGDTEFPHLHLTVRQGDTAVDPFAPEASGTCGALPDRTLWADPPAFPQGGVTDAGFATAVPAYDIIRAGTADAPPAPDQPLVLFGLLFGGRVGDEVSLDITGPDGVAVLSHAEPLDRTQALLFRAAGLRPPRGGWPPGRYEGTVMLRRDGAEVGRFAASTEMPPG
ncbi:M23 family metallopeptidase [Rubellimicrobium roseum]|uniref:M23 family metallopeptidase n=1 Tax=Rubellimicrobium roseum TaxID=687525 RepID=A0A5C4NNQ4_9RHOB|nr:M23 family metallopeptidase [Rubellimicrobium roseum]TNC74696.1 M23 family metallopeptidase [Rubellimicrobium roseum]